MAQTNLCDLLEEALTKAFAAKDRRVRSAYMDLADFYDRRLRELEGPHDRSGPRYFR